MLTLCILGVGLSIVIGGILGLRLHAFVALVLAGMAVALLTPTRLVERSAVLEAAIAVESVSADGVISTASETTVTDAVLLLDHGRDNLLTDPASVSLLPDGQLHVMFGVNRDSEIASLPPANELILISRSDYESAQELAASTFVSRIKSTIGEYCGKLAILIVAASIIGRCLLDSGAADRIVNSTLSLLGQRMAPAAFVFSGFTLGIPVFFDTVFYLMIPLGKALRLRTGGNYLLYVLSIVAGGTMAHSLVPPTPGPLFIAEEFGVPISSMILGGCIVGLFSASVGMLYAFWINSRCELPLRDIEEVSAAAGPSDENAPGLFASLVPIVLPVVLITGGSLLSKSADKTDLFAGNTISPDVARAIRTLSEKNLALLISAAFAVVMYVRTKSPSRDQLSESLQHAIASAGPIILVTAAGGAFGRMMRQTSVSELLNDLPGTSPVMIIVAAFLVTTAVRTAQGSATVAMITSAGIFGGIVAGGAAGVDPLYVALAVGCGSKPIAWMNDSGFWVITRMSGMTEGEGLKYITPMTALAGIAGLLAVIGGVVVFP
ncbi:MAG: GntP family permease [Fuerstiella sp.]|nr:GntP family permease [Fuerstiella sp.]MCP4858288.1 GntP family permease [Fuerstiella sp.]